MTVFASKTVLNFLFDSLQVHRLLDHIIVVPDFILVDRLAERPRVLVLEEDFKHVLALVLKTALIRLLFALVPRRSPASFSKTRDLVEVVLSFTVTEFQTWVFLEADILQNLSYQSLHTPWGKKVEFRAFNLRLFAFGCLHTELNVECVSGSCTASSCFHYSP